MARQQNLRGLARIDVLVAGVTCLLLVPLVPMALAMTREHHFRLVCGANLAQIGKTMFMYADDYEDELPRAGGRTTEWGQLCNWQGSTRMQAFGIAADGSGGRATISSSFYLLVSYFEVPTRRFVCPGDQGTTEFKLAAVATAANVGLADLWDFGPAATAFKSCSFSYHHPYSPHPLTISRDPNLAVAADRNPWIRSPAADPPPFAFFRPDLLGQTGVPETARVGNAVAHGKDGQNVLFLDGRVTFQTRAYCGIAQDNIYTPSGLPDRGSAVGMAFAFGHQPTCDKDSYLVHDPDVFISGGTGPR